MALHGISHVTVAVPDPAPCIDFYAEFGLTPAGAGLASADGGEQLHLVVGERRRVLEVVLGADDADDLAQMAERIAAAGLAASLAGDELRAHDAASAITFVVAVRDRITSAAAERVATNAPGRDERVGARADALGREGPVRPRRLSHVAVTSTDVMATRALLLDGFGLRISDEVPGGGAFMRASSHHHDIAVLPAPVAVLHHSAWEVDDVDEVGRGGAAMINADPARQLWGLGRHWLGSNFFWYLRDPAGNFAEYTSDLDVIVDDEAWVPMAPADLRALYAWGPPVPGDFIAPPDLMALLEQG